MKRARTGIWKFSGGEGEYPFRFGPRGTGKRNRFLNGKFAKVDRRNQRRPLPCYQQGSKGVFLLWWALGELTP